MANQNSGATCMAVYRLATQGGSVRAEGALGVDATLNSNSNLKSTAHGLAKILGMLFCTRVCTCLHLFVDVDQTRHPKTAEELSDDLRNLEVHIYSSADI